MSVLPGSWAEVRLRLAVVFGGGPQGEADAAEWLREALSAAYAGVQDEGDLPRIRRGVALQKASGTLLALEEMGELAFALDLRQIVARTFARYWDGVALQGPPWRLSPAEDLPTHEAWARSSDFGE